MIQQKSIHTETLASFSFWFSVSCPALAGMEIYVSINHQNVNSAIKLAKLYIWLVLLSFYILFHMKLVKFGVANPFSYFVQSSSMKFFAVAFSLLVIGAVILTLNVLLPVKPLFFPSNIHAHDLFSQQIIHFRS